MNLDNLIEIAAAATCIGAGVACILFRNATFRIERAISFYEETRAELKLEMQFYRDAKHDYKQKANAFYGQLQGQEPEPRNLCGGCGLSLTVSEINACPGATCANFALHLNGKLGTIPQPD